MKIQNVLMVAILCTLAFFGAKSYVGLMEENREMQGRISQLTQTLAHSTINLQRDSLSDGRETVTQPPIIIDKTDYKRLEADKKLIEELKLKIDQVESENRTLLSTQGQVVFKTAADSDSVLRYSDRWASFEYLVKPHKLNYSVLDSLTIIVSRQYKHRFLWLRWGTKGYQVHTVNHNPNATVVYNRYIKVEH